MEDAAKELNIEMNDEKCQLVSNFQMIEEWHNHITQIYEQASLYYFPSHCLHSIEHLPIIPVDSKIFLEGPQKTRSQELTGIPSLVRFIWG